MTQIKMSVLMGLIQQRLIERETLLARQGIFAAPTPDSYIPTHSERLEKAGRETARLIVGNEIAFLKALLHECENPLPGAAR